jgi:predicted metal-binding membrane protein
MSAPALEGLLRRDRLIVGVALALIVTLAWAWVLAGSGTGMSTAAMTTWQFPPPRPAMGIAGDWTVLYWLIMLAMWWVMMVAMMLPSAAPMILLHARVMRHAQATGRAPKVLAPTAAFVAGYLACWLGFSVAATLLQFACERLGVLDGMMMWVTERKLTAALLVVAGLYQFSPWKTACLMECRSPVEFLARHARPGRAGAFRLGLVHGAYCLGCCWALMLLLFAAGIMNLVWITGLAILVLVEKLAPFGVRLQKPIGVLLIATGVGVAALG